MINSSVSLVGFHGGRLGYDPQHGQLQCYKNGFPHAVQPVYFDGQHIFILKDQGKAYLYTAQNQFAFTSNIQEVNLKIEHYGVYIYIYAQDHYLSCRSDLKINACATKALGWERFYLQPQAGNELMQQLHDKDIFEYNKKAEARQIEKNIWVYWESNTPALVEIALEKIKNLNPDYTFHFISQDNISQYINIDLFNTNISPTFRSDLLRLMLLNQFGGVWIDASIIMNQPLKQILGLKESNETYYDLMGFYRKAHYLYDLPCVESWLLAAPKDSFTIKAWLQVLLDALYLSPDELLEQLKQHPQFDQIRNSYSDQSLKYFLVYLAQQKVFIDEKNKVSVKAFCADHSAFYFKETYGWSNPDRYHTLTHQRENEITLMPALIKLTKQDRVLFTHLKAENKFNPYAYLAHYL